ncbi:hypothetical protein [Pectobacterium punjabense]|uniref:hypothetical protein n=1 Tax=Pectobacterium punjabense TaxID=2108399 RepID=UPI0038138CCE
MATFLDPDKIGRTFFIAPVATARKRVICGADGRNIADNAALMSVSITSHKRYLAQ